MGRAFATVYRIVLVGVSLAALILSIMSATSCAFIKYDHQYKDDNENDGGRFLLFSLSSSSSLSSSFDVTQQRHLPQSTAMPENDDAPTDDAPTEDAPTDDAPLTTTATDDATTDDDGATKDVHIFSNGTKTTTTKHSNGTSTVAHLHPNGTKVTTHSDGTTITSRPTPTTTSTGGGNNQITHASGGTTSVVKHTNGTTTAIMKHPNGTTVTNNPDGTSTTVHNNINVVADDDSIPVNDDATSPSTSTPALGSSSSSSSSVITGAAAATTGDAGLFCDGIQSFTITSLWNGSYQDLEDKIADDSDRNQSEELARNAAIVASLFGSVIIVILSIGGSIGWRCFCERWIVGLVAFMACVSQGITFLLFNSEQYCDGDIINEIINQEPCILGEGGKDSVAALALYAIVMVLGCRLPQDDPYGWCSRCKMGGGRNAGYSSNNDPIGDGGSPGGGGKSSSGLLFGSSKNGSSSSINDTENGNNTARSGREHERPNWLSEEAAREKEEHEII